MEQVAHSISRRRFLKKSGDYGALAAAATISPAYARGADSKLAADASGNLIELNIAETQIEVAGKQVKTTTINGTVPGPLVRLKEGSDALLRVTNHLREDSSIHWHGLILPFRMDGVPGISYDGIKPGETFEYRFPVTQSGTYWYHSHSGLQEQTGVYGPLIIDPVAADPLAVDREYVIVLSDWVFGDPHRVLKRLKKQADYYNYQKRTVPDFFRDSRQNGLLATVKNRLSWSKMRMAPTDISDVTGYAYTYLMNGNGLESNWTGLFKPGEKVRLRFINAAAMSYFDVRIPGLKLTVVQADGQNIQPVAVDEFRISVAETYDVIVEPEENRAYTIFAESIDRSGYARGTLAPRSGMSAAVPKRRKRPLLTMEDMGMAMGGMKGMNKTGGESSGSSSMAGMSHEKMKASVKENSPSPVGKGGGMPRMKKSAADLSKTYRHGPDRHGVGNTTVATISKSRLNEPGIGLGNDGRKVLVYTDLKSPRPGVDLRPPRREIELHLTGNMDRYMWSFDGESFSKRTEPIRLVYGERVRLTFINDTMMNHPIHLHGMWMVLNNGNGQHNPRKHTINVKPAEHLSADVTVDAPGNWAFHCHLIFHMDMGMFRVVSVSKPMKGKAGA